MKFLTYYRYLIGIFILLLSFHAYSGTATGKIIDYATNKFNIFSFALDVPETSKPACNTANRYAVSTSTQAGRDVMSSIVNAKNVNLTVSVSGLNTCTAWGDSEDVNVIQVR